MLSYAESMHSHRMSRWVFPRCYVHIYLMTIPLSPFLQREWWIGYYAVELSHLSTLQDFRIAESVTLHNVEVACTMKEKVHLCNSRVNHILLLTEDVSTTEATMIHVMYGLNKHTTITASWVIDSLTGLRIEDAYK